LSGAPEVFVAAHCSVANERLLSEIRFRVPERLLLAVNRLMGLPIPDTQCENPRSVGKGRFVTQSGNPSSYKAVIEANESGRPAVEKLEPFHPGLLVIVLFAGGHLKGALCTPHVPV
jgi:hypothetical protein